MLALTDFSYW